MKLSTTCVLGVTPNILTQRVSRCGEFHVRIRRGDPTHRQLWPTVGTVNLRKYHEPKPTRHRIPSGVKFKFEVAQTYNLDCKCSTCDTHLGCFRASKPHHCHDHWWIPVLLYKYLGVHRLSHIHVETTWQVFNHTQIYIYISNYNEFFIHLHPCMILNHTQIYPTTSPVCWEVPFFCWLNRNGNSATSCIFEDDAPGHSILGIHQWTHVYYTLVI